MIKMCHIISGDLWAGAEVMTYNLLKGLKRYDNISLLVIVLNEGRLAEEIRKHNIMVHVVDENKKSFFKILMEIRKILKENQIHVIHSHRYKENIIAFLISISIKGLQLIATQHGLPELHSKELRLKQRLITKLNFLLLSKFFHRVVAVSQNIKEFFEKNYSFKKDRLNVIHNGIEIPYTISAGHEKKFFTIGSSGRLFPVKDYTFMVEIAKEVLKGNNHVRFLLAGDGPDKERINAHIKRYGIEEKFKLMGHLNDMLEFYKKLDLYLNTSVHEGIPMSILEAMSHGIPVVAPMVGGLSEIIKNGDEGFLLTKRDPRDFAEKCLAINANLLLQRKMSEKAMEKVSKSFSLQKMSEDYYKLYVDLAGRYCHVSCR